jgi:hypothetical protein
MQDFSSMLLWDEETRGSFGPGISRPKEGEVTRQFTVVVKQQQARPMKVVLAAASKRKAVQYAQNRWPGAAVEAA